MQSLYIGENEENKTEVINFFKAHYDKIELITVNNQEDALSKITLGGPFGSILIELDIKTDPIILSQKLLEIGGERPVVFIGDKELIKQKVDEKLLQGEDSLFDIIRRPFVTPDLLQSIDSTKKWTKNENFSQSLSDVDSDNLLPLKVRNFYLFNSVPFDVYIELSQYKFLKILNKDEKYTISKLTRFSRKNIKFFLLEKDDFIQFLERGIHKVTENLKKKSLKAKDKINLQAKGLLLLQQHVLQLGVSEELIIFTNLLIKSFSEVFEQEKESLSKLLELISIEKGSYAEKTLLNIYVSYGMLNQLAWNAPMTRGKLALAALLSDITLENDKLLKTIDNESKLFLTLNEKNQNTYLNHPKDGSAFAQFFVGYSEIDFLILQHHEKPLGDGFPEGINHNKLTKLSCLFIISSKFTNEIFSRGTLSDAKDILKLITVSYNSGHFRSPIEAFKNSVKT